jgi:hypothetical protein
MNLNDTLKMLMYNQEKFYKNILDTIQSFQLHLFSNFDLKMIKTMLKFINLMTNHIV